MTDSKLLDKLAKIRAHAESAQQIGNEAEAQAFAGMLQQLLLKYKLDMTDIEYSAELKGEEIVQSRPQAKYEHGKYVWSDAPDVEIKHQRIDWVERLGQVIARYHSCQVLCYGGTSHIGFVGHASNVAICEYLFVTMLRAADKISAKAAMKFRREWRDSHGGAGNTPPGYRESFLYGFVKRIDERLEEARTVFAGEGGGTALVRISKEAEAVATWIAANIKFSTNTKGQPRGWSNYNEHGLRDGKATADGIGIDANAFKAGNSKPNGQLA